MVEIGLQADAGYDVGEVNDGMLKLQSVFSERAFSRSIQFTMLKTGFHYKTPMLDLPDPAYNSMGYSAEVASSLADSRLQAFVANSGLPIPCVKQSILIQNGTHICETGYHDSGRVGAQNRTLCIQWQGCETTCGNTSYCSSLAIDYVFPYHKQPPTSLEFVCQECVNTLSPVTCWKFCSSFCSVTPGILRCKAALLFALTLNVLDVIARMMNHCYTHSSWKGDWTLVEKFCRFSLWANALIVPVLMIGIAFVYNYDKAFMEVLKVHCYLSCRLRGY
jgi:hypothetical protein